MTRWETSMGLLREVVRVDCQRNGGRMTEAAASLVARAAPLIDLARCHSMLVIPSTGEVARCRLDHGHEPDHDFTEPRT